MFMLRKLSRRAPPGVSVTGWRRFQLYGALWYLVTALLLLLGHTLLSCLLEIYNDLQSMASPVDTPTKVSKNLNISPKTKSSSCIVCGEYISDVRYRRKLFRGYSKTEVCLSLEKHLDIVISSECSPNIVCKKCQHKLNRAEEILEQLKLSYSRNVSKLYDTHGSETRKRLLKDTDCDNSKNVSRRKALFPDLTPDPNYSSATNEVTQRKENTNVVRVTTPGGQVITVSDNFYPLLKALHSDDFKSISKVALNTTLLRTNIIELIIQEINAEVTRLCSKEEQSVLRRSDKLSLLGFNWDKIVNEWKTKAPIYWAFLEIFISNPSLKRNKVKNAASLLPGLVTAGSKLLSLYNQQLNLVQHFNSVVLLQGGAKKSLFRRLNATYDALSYTATINHIENYASDWSKAINSWKQTCEIDFEQEKILLANISHLEQDIVHYGGTPDRILYLDSQKSELRNHQTTMHPGYYFVGDNVDFYTRVRSMTAVRQNQSQHMFQMCAYKNRISGNDLDDTCPQEDADTVPFSKFIPSSKDAEILIEEFAYFVAKTWAEYIPSFKCFGPALPAFLPHEYLLQTKKKTERIPLGVLQKNEQYNDEMSDIVEFLHHFVPGHSDNVEHQDSPQKILSGGDYLTFERQKYAHHALGDGPTPSSRRQGLVPKMEEFHNQAEFLKVIWKHLYSAKSSGSVGTLHAARSVINAVNVTQDPHAHYYPCSEFMDKVSSAYIVTGGLQHFKMEQITSEPVPSYQETVGDPHKMKEYLMQHARAFVRIHVMPKLPVLPTYGPSTNIFDCRYCDKRYHRPKSLRKHEARVHHHPDPDFNPQDFKEMSHYKKQLSSAYEYTRLCLMLGLLRLNHNDAIHMGDGGRMLRLMKWFCLYYKASKCTKYAIGLFETQAQALVLLSQRQAHRLVWNRTVNHQGKPDTNHPNDLDLEHCNRAFKEGVHTYMGRYTEKTISRVSRSSLPVDELCKKYDKLAFSKQTRGRQGKVDFSDDILKLVHQFHQFGKLFSDEASNRYPEFQDLRDPMSLLDMADVQRWISENLKVFKSRIYYEI